MTAGLPNVKPGFSSLQDGTIGNELFEERPVHTSLIGSVAQMWRVWTGDLVDRSNAVDGSDHSALAACPAKLPYMQLPDEERFDKSGPWIPLEVNPQVPDSSPGQGITSFESHVCTCQRPITS